MASPKVNCSPKTFSPRVLIHRTDFAGFTNACKRGKPNMLLSKKDIATSQLHPEPVNFELRNTESNQKHEMKKVDRETLKMRRDFPLNHRRFIDQRVAIENSSNACYETRVMSQFDPPAMKYICRCCKCCCNDLPDFCLPQGKDDRDFRTILPQILKINDDHFYDDPKSDTLRWTLYNTSIVNKNLLNLSCNGAVPFGGPIWSNRWIYPDLETYAHHLIKKEIIGNNKGTSKSVTSIANSTESSISSSCLAKALPISIGNAYYNACDSKNRNHVFWPLLSRTSSVQPVSPSATSLSLTIPSSSSASTPPPSGSCSPSNTTSSSMSSVCLFRQASFFSYDRKPLLCDDFSSTCLQTNIKRNPTEDADSAGANKRFKYSDENISAGSDHLDVPFVNSVTATHDTKHNGAGITKTTSIYKVPNDSVYEKRQIQKTKNFHCPFCNISCSNRGQLQGHVRIHTGERPFVCQEPHCGKAFIRNEELTRHRRIHTGERPHICPVCKKAFTRKDHLNKHMKTHT